MVSEPATVINYDRTLWFLIETKDQLKAFH